GNIRELEHIISRAALRAKASVHHRDIISLTSKMLDITQDNSLSMAMQHEHEVMAELMPNDSLKSATEIFQRKLISQALTTTDANWAESAKLLKMDRSNLVRLAKRLDICVEKNIRIVSDES
ncbi:hypothetical protein LCGC14_3049130, partial [marine sediment metagenome]